MDHKDLVFQYIFGSRIQNHIHNRGHGNILEHLQVKMNGGTRIDFLTLYKMIQYDLNTVLKGKVPLGLQASL